VGVRRSAWHGAINKHGDAFLFRSTLEDTLQPVALPRKHSLILPTRKTPQGVRLTVPRVEPAPLR
jgi:hypothetical protein